MDMTTASTSAPESDSINSGFIISMEVYIVLIMIVGIPGNMFTILSVARYKKLRSSGPILVATLSLSDTLYYAFVLPLRLATLIHQDWRFGNALCQAVAGVAHWTFGISMSCLACIAFNRYTHVLKPVMYKRIFSKAGLTAQLGTMWILVGVLTMAFPISQVWGAYSYQHHILSCTFSPDQPKSYQYFVMTVGLTIPFIFIITCYSLIYCTVRSSQKRLQSWSTNNKTIKVTPAPLNPPTQPKQNHTIAKEKETPVSATGELHSSNKSKSSNLTAGKTAGNNKVSTTTTTAATKSTAVVPLSKQQKQNRDSLKMTLMMVCTFALYMVCLCPYLVLGVVDSEQELPVAYLASLMLTWLNGCLNPVIYVLMNGQFRQAGQEMLCRRKVAAANKQQQALNATATAF